MSDSLESAARVAWRNHPRCIGRLFWNSLEVFDATHLSHPQEIFQACVRHLRYSTNGGRIRPTATIFAPSGDPRSGIRIHNRQLIRYAAYSLQDGSIMGDPEQLEFTRFAVSLGWTPPNPQSPFDILPLIISAPGFSTQLFTIPSDAVLEVPIRHPDLPGFNELGIRWPALPAVSDMILSANGKFYPAAPFSGFYMGTEIGSRNLGDTNRYNLLPTVAKLMKLDLSSRTSLWKDRALVELNAAVILSFQAAKVTIVDHHTAAAQFMQHIKNEEKSGRTIPGDWPWLVPPLSGSACPVFHRYYDPPVAGPQWIRCPS